MHDNEKWVYTPVKFITARFIMCFGGSSPSPPPPPPPPPQLAKTPDAATVRNETAANNTAQGGGQVQTPLLTGGQGAQTTEAMLGKKTLLGK